MRVIVESIEIEAPIGRVFDRLAAPERAPEWTPNLIRVERTSAIAAGPGLETRLVASVGGRRSNGKGRCLQWDPPRLLVLHTALEVGVTSTATFTLTAAGAMTFLTAQVEYSLPAGSIGRLLGGLIGEPIARRDLRQALAALKRQLEEEA